MMCRLRCLESGGKAKFLITLWRVRLRVYLQNLHILLVDHLKAFAALAVRR